MRGEPGCPLELGDFKKRQRARSDLPLLREIMTDEDAFDDVPDFHRQVKAEYLTLSPTQILRETTLAPDAFTQRPTIPSAPLQRATPP